jgi:Ca2+/H+ antiporter
MPPQIEKIHPGDETETIEQTISVEQKENTINIQKYLLTLIFIQWIVFAITLTFGLYSVLTGNTTTISSGIQSLIPIIILVIYYTFGFLVAYKLHRVGLLFVSNSNLYNILFFYVSLHALEWCYSSASVFLLVIYS